MKSSLIKVWKLWKQIGRVIGDFIGRFILSVFYFTIALPFGVGMRIFSDPLKIRPDDAPSFWLQRETEDCVLENARKQS